MRIAVQALTLGQKGVIFLEHGQDNFVGFFIEEAGQALSRLGHHKAAVIDWAIRSDAVFLADIVIVDAVPGGGVNQAGTSFVGDMFAIEN